MLYLSNKCIREFISTTCYLSSCVFHVVSLYVVYAFVWCSFLNHLCEMSKKWHQHEIMLDFELQMYIYLECFCEKQHRNGNRVRLKWNEASDDDDDGAVNEWAVTYEFHYGVFKSKLSLHFAEITSIFINNFVFVDSISVTHIFQSAIPANYFIADKIISFMWTHMCLLTRTRFFRYSEFSIMQSQIEFREMNNWPKSNRDLLKSVERKREEANAEVDWV